MLTRTIKCYTFLDICVKYVRLYAYVVHAMIFVYILYDRPLGFGCFVNGIY